MKVSYPALNSKFAMACAGNSSSLSATKVTWSYLPCVLKWQAIPTTIRFPECADAARADYLVTGNLRHFPRFWKKTKIITPREFIGLEAPHLTT